MLPLMQIDKRISNSIWSRKDERINKVYKQTINFPPPLPFLLYDTILKAAQNGSPTT